MNTVMVYHSGIRDTIWCPFCVPSGHEPCFSLELHAYIKYDMTVDILISDQLLNQSLFFLIRCDYINPFSCNLCVTHLLIECLLPVIIPHFLVNPKCLLGSHGQLDPKLMCHSVHTVLTNATNIYFKFLYESSNCDTLQTSLGNYTNFQFVPVQQVSPRVSMSLNTYTLA